MADHKIDGNDGAGNVQAPERIWMFAETLKSYLPGGGKIMMGDTAYIRADVAAQLSAANARDAAMVEAAGICINAGAYYKNVAVARHRSEMDYSAAEFASLKLMESSDDILALRDKPAPAVTVRDSFAGLIADARTEAEKAIKKFPQPNYVLLKVAEEAGEVVKAGVHFAEGRETRENVKSEMIQTIAMLYRLWVEGDQVNGVPPIAPPEA